MERITPSLMKANPEEQKTEAGAAAKPETARAENTAEGHCPICGMQMRALIAGEHPVLACTEHNIVMPMRD